MQKAHCQVFHLISKMLLPSLSLSLLLSLSLSPSLTRSCHYITLDILRDEQNLIALLSTTTSCQRDWSVYDELVAQCALRGPSSPPIGRERRDRERMLQGTNPHYKHNRSTTTIITTSAITSTTTIDTATTTTTTTTPPSPSSVSSSLQLLQPRTCR